MTTPQQRLVLDNPQVTLVGTDARGRPVVEAMVGIPNSLHRWSVKRDGDPTDVSEPVTPVPTTIADIHYADLKQYPPERTSEGTCTHCDKPARWVVLTVPAAAVRVCAEHLGKIWNAQGRPEVPGGDRS